MHRRPTMTKTSLTRASLGDHEDIFKNSIWSSGLEEKAPEDRTREDDYRGGLSFQLGPEFDRGRNVHKYNEYKRNWDKSAQQPHSNGNSKDSGTRHADECTMEGVESLDQLWSFFGRQTTFHGVKNIESHERRQSARIFWLVLVLSMAGILIYTVANLLIEYYKYNTVTRTDVKVRSGEVFPSVTLCNTCPYRNKAGTPEVMKRLVANTSVLPGFFPLNMSDPEVIAAMGQSMLYIQEEYSFKAEDIFFLVTYEGQPLNVSEDFEYVDTTMGRCFTFNGPQYIARHGAHPVLSDGRNSGLRLYVRLFQDEYFIYEEMTAGMRMFISSYPDTPRLSKDGIDIMPGVSARVALSPVKFTFLPAPYSSYGGESCDDRSFEELIPKMVNATFYSYDLCLEQCINHFCANSCGCYTPLLYLPDMPDCTMGEVLSCFNPCHARTNPSMCDCPRPCSFTRFQVTLSQSQLPSRVAAQFLALAINSSNPQALRYSHLLPHGDSLGEDYLELRVYFDTMMVRHEQHEPQFTFNSMFAFLGGQMGFFLGASLITLSELLETLLYSVYVFLNKKLTRMGQLKKKPAASASKTSAQSHNNVAANSRSNATNVIPIKQAW